MHARSAASRDLDVQRLEVAREQLPVDGAVVDDEGHRPGGLIRVAPPPRSASRRRDHVGARGSARLGEPVEPAGPAGLSMLAGRSAARRIAPSVALLDLSVCAGGRSPPRPRPRPRRIAVEVRRRLGDVGLDQLARRTPRRRRPRPQLVEDPREHRWASRSASASSCSLGRLRGLVRYSLALAMPPSMGVRASASASSAGRIGLLM